MIFIESEPKKRGFVVGVVVVVPVVLIFVLSLVGVVVVALGLIVIKVWSKSGQ